ncbi:MAG: hypothetical protein ACP5KV_06805 [Candidatus Methanomethylicaceae archaeon]
MGYGDENASRAFELRSQQLSLLSKIEHKMAIDPEVGVLLERIEKHPDYHNLNEMEKRNVYLIRKFYDEYTKLPEKLVSEIARQQAIAYESWKRAKAAKDFSIFRPLEKIFELKMQSAEFLMAPKGIKVPYDAMIDFFEPKVTQEIITKVFEELKRGIIPIIKKICGNF